MDDAIKDAVLEVGNATHISRDAMIASLQTTYFAFLRVIAPSKRIVVN